MKWNIEWVDLQNIEHMVAECWRMGGHQLEKYVQKLSKQQELVFAGDLGIKFLELLRRSIDTGKTPDWSKLQKDIHLMQELIQDGQAQHDVYWRSQYQELSANPKAYFGTEFGGAFTEQLAAKLELGISEEQRMLQHDIAKIQRICSTCNWDDEKKAKKALQLLTQDEKYYFSSWLGDAFINVLQERYGKKEEEEETGFIVQPEVTAVEKSSFRGKILLTLAVCILIGFICLLLYLQSDGGRGREKLQKIFSDVRSVIDVVPGRNGQENQAVDLNAADVQGSQTADLNAADVQGGQAESMYGADTSENHPENLYQSDTEKEDRGNLYKSESGEDTEHPDAGNTEETGRSSGPDSTDAGNPDSGPGSTDAGNPDSGPDSTDAGDRYSGPDSTDAGDRYSGSDSTDAGSRNRGHSLDSNTADTGVEGDSNAAVNNQRAAELPDILPQYASFHQKYPDLFGWLKIPGTEIDHPVMQSDDEARGERYFYLHRDYTGKKTEAGSLFVEGASSCFPQDRNTVIYGHNMSNGHNFGMLEQYKDAEFFQKHPVLQYDTIYETGSYQIAAVLITRILYQDEDGFRYYRFYNYHSRQEFQECAEFIKANQLYDTGVELQYGDQLVMLSTCEYSRPNGRLVVVAKKTG